MQSLGHINFALKLDIALALVVEGESLQQQRQDPWFLCHLTVLVWESTITMKQIDTSRSIASVLNKDQTDDSQCPWLAFRRTGCSKSCFPRRLFLSWRTPSTLSSVEKKSVVYLLIHPAGSFSLFMWQKIHCCLYILVTGKRKYHAVGLTAWISHR